ncbi:hypothetical protein [Medusavirus stheno T3]|uniref:Transmembrane protein n=1 Tax=Medusavirus stheno T3 TaxID=3069717 RepID=A0A7S7YEB4_9VIRU|nr:hypothetical protein QKU73_gp023 [Acanthamoeba castellanii medusavirus]QPB44204.1 hypothetical protein [Medusavirus stheno T3]
MPPLTFAAVCILLINVVAWTGVILLAIPAATEPKPDPAVCAMLAFEPDCLSMCGCGWCGHANAKAGACYWSYRSSCVGDDATFAVADCTERNTAISTAWNVCWVLAGVGGVLVVWIFWRAREAREGYEQIP